MSTTAPPVMPRQNAMLGIAYMCLAVTLFACLDTTAKYLAVTAGLPTLQLVWLRFLGQFLLMVGFFLAMRQPVPVRSRRPGLQLARSIMLLGSTLMNFWALQYLRLDQTTAMMFLAPLVIALLAGPVLGEWVGWRRMTAILVGFLGIVIAVRPGFTEVHPAIGLSFLSMLNLAVFSLLTRFLAAHDRAEVTLFWSLIAGVFAMAPLALWVWVWPAGPVAWLLLLSMGLYGGLGHLCFILAYRAAEAGTVTPFYYTQLVGMAVLGYLVFGDVPDAPTILGALLIVGSGVYLANRERKLRRAAAE